MKNHDAPVIVIPSEKVPVVRSVDVCVIGGSCTGVFAAVRAARLGKSVCLLEQSGLLGGVATQDFVSVWHSLYDTGKTRQIIGGLTAEVLERLKRRGACRGEVAGWSLLNTDELAIELDELVSAEKNLSVMLHSSYLSPLMSEDGKRVEAVVGFKKSGKFAIRARFFVDASGDGLLCRDAGVPMWTSPTPQPPTACCRLENAELFQRGNWKELIARYRAEFPDLFPGD